MHAVSCSNPRVSHCVPQWDRRPSMGHGAPLRPTVPRCVLWRVRICLRSWRGVPGDLENLHHLTLSRRRSAAGSIGMRSPVHEERGYRLDIRYRVVTTQWSPAAECVVTTQYNCSTGSRCVP